MSAVEMTSHRKMGDDRLSRNTFESGDLIEYGGEEKRQKLNERKV